MERNEIEARIKEIRAELNADKKRVALETELHGLEDQLNSIRAEELIPQLLEEEADNHCVTAKGDGQFELEIYKDYDDAISMDTIREIVQSKDPQCAYWDAINEMYDQSADYYIDQLIDAVCDKLGKNDIVVTEEIRESVENTFRNNLELIYPDFDNQEVNVNIFIDSGDANYEYVLNSQYPGSAFNAERPPQPGEEGYKPYNPEDVLDPKAGIVWLASTQGYTLRQLHEALLNDDIIPEETSKKLANMELPKLTFLQSMYLEMANNSSACPCVVFMVRITLGNLIKLTELVNLQEKAGDIYDATKRPDCGTLVIGKETKTGLFDLINGGGSLQFDIQLEKDVEIPIRFIRSATPDINNCQGVTWCVGDVYGLCGDAWRDTLKEIKEPQPATAE